MERCGADDGRPVLDGLLAFLLASTNLVIELGIVIAVFLSWQFVVGEYLEGILLILITWVLVRIFYPENLVETAREHAREQEGSDGDSGDPPDPLKLIRSREGWLKVAKHYTMEWGMVWKDVTIGFTVAGIIAAFVPKTFFQALFVGSSSSDPAFWQVLAQVLIGPMAAFFTFIGSMGNIPLAAVLFENGVSFAGVIAFIFSDLVVFPVLRIQAEYYGWKMALYILGIFLAALTVTSLLLHYGFSLAGFLPDHSGINVTDREFFKINYSFWLNALFIGLSAGFWIWKQGAKEGAHCHEHGGSKSIKEIVLGVLAGLSFVWLAGGLIVGML
jgi:uncharacterized membrane protein YraQ (UPF0718 family)